MKCVTVLAVLALGGLFARAIDINAGGTAVLTFKITGSDDTLATFVNSKKDSLKGSLTADIQLKLTMKGIFGTILRGVTLSITGNDVEASVSVQDVYAKDDKEAKAKIQDVIDNSESDLQKAVTNAVAVASMDGAGAPTFTIQESAVGSFAVTPKDASGGGSGKDPSNNVAATATLKFEITGSDNTLSNFVNENNNNMNIVKAALLGGIGSQLPSGSTVQSASSTSLSTSGNAVEASVPITVTGAEDNKAAKDIVQGHLDNNKKSDIQEAVKNAVNTAVPSANIKNSDVSSFDVTFQSSAAALRLGLGVVGVMALSMLMLA